LERKPINFNWNRIIQQENARIEWKENVGDVRGVVKTLCAFANDLQQVGGGRVICGLKEETNEFGAPEAIPVGLEDARFKKIRNEVLNICHRHVEPPLTPVVNSDPVADDPSRKILIFEVAASQFAHRYRIKDQGTHYYVRVNDQTRTANGLTEKLLEQKKRWPPFLEQTHPDATLNALDRSALKKFFHERNLPQDMDAYLEPNKRIRGDVQSMVTLPPGSSTQPVPRNFSILLFCQNPEEYFPGSFAVLSIYQGKDKTADRSKKYEIFGPIPSLIHNLFDKLQLHMGVEIDKSPTPLTGGSVGSNRPRYSERAVKEAIVNAFVHRDYHSHDPVRVTVFIDRIEVSSPGILFNGLQIEDLKKGNSHPSWRNPSLAWFMVSMEFAQNEGQGIPTIMNDTRKVSGREPVFDISGNWFRLTIPAFMHPAESPGSIRKPPRDATGKDALILISIGGASIEKQVKESLNTLGLQDPQIVINFFSTDFVEGDNWETLAAQLRQEVQAVVDSPEYERFHLFYRGPVVFPPLLGALISPNRRLLLYEYDNGRYTYTYQIDKKFLKG